MKDTLYIWKVKNSETDCKSLYKFGVTSHERGYQRIQEVADINKWEYEIIAYVSFDESLEYAVAIGLETEFLCEINFEKMKMGRFDGSTEFRWLPDNDLEIVKAILDVRIAEYKTGYRFDNYWFNEFYEDTVDVDERFTNFIPGVETLNLKRLQEIRNSEIEELSEVGRVNNRLPYCVYPN